MFCSQCLHKHIASKPLNRVNGMSRGELVEAPQLQRQAEVMGSRWHPLPCQTCKRGLLVHTPHYKA